MKHTIGINLSNIHGKIKSTYDMVKYNHKYTTILSEISLLFYFCVREFGWGNLGTHLLLTTLLLIF